ncbi:MAG TPA: cyclic-di-AMP-binding protein CbpB [Massilibacterium sp.]|nr:cyclic-di-AMP-binding protein CbpB [Massilibacterium sp.]
MMSIAQQPRFQIEDLMIEADKVAHVQLNNPLEHALLVLVKSGYSAVPVLDSSFKLHGIVSKTLILDALLGMERIEFEKLEDLLVSDVMNADIPRLTMQSSMSTVLEAVVDYPFVCVEDKEQIFSGIVTRRNLLLKLRNEWWMRGK